MPPKLTARGTAVVLLDAVLEERQMLSQVPLPVALSPSERARAARLASETLRHLSALDAALDPLLRKKPPLHLRNILRLATYELARGGADHGVVSAAVDSVKQSVKTRHMSGLINAVLRTIAAQPPTLDTAQMLPRWLRQPLVKHYGRDTVRAIEAAQSKAPPIDITLRAQDAQSAPLLGGRVLPNGSVRLSAGQHISALPGYEDGAWWVQDAAAATAVQLLGALRGDARVLDLCAAPGGKTMQLASTGAQVSALDISSARLERLRENLARTGLSAQIITADALHWTPPQPFDAILLDAPCSATGTIRRHPDLPYVKDGEDLAALTALQSELIDRALGWLTPGGRLLFCTCSLRIEEGEAQLDAALSRHANLRVVRPELPWIEAAWITPQGGLRLRPDYWAEHGGMDGFFMACLIKE